MSPFTGLSIVRSAHGVSTGRERQGVYRDAVSLATE
jgi:hypothetical protein